MFTSAKEIQNIFYQQNYQMFQINTIKFNGYIYEKPKIMKQKKIP